MRTEPQTISTAFAASLAASVLLTGCLENGNGDEFGEYEDVPLISVNCDPADPGISQVRTNGSPGDAFRVRYFCGNALVSACTATVPAGQTSQACASNPATIPNSRAKRCQVAPQNGNSPAAAFQGVRCQ